MVERTRCEPLKSALLRYPEERRPDRHLEAGPKLAMLQDPETRRAVEILSEITDLTVALRRPIHNASILFGIVKITTGYPHQISVLSSVILAALIFLSPRIVLIFVTLYGTIIVYPKQQKIFDEVSASTFTGKDSAKKIKTAIYLRPFKFDECYFVYPLSHGSVSKAPVGLEGYFTQLCAEFQIAVIALGGVPSRRGQSGAGRATTSDADWQIRISEQIEKAILIIIIPSSDPGTLWELGVVCASEEFLDKTLFIMPPRRRGSVYLALQSINYLSFCDGVEEMWHTARIELLNKRLLLPAYNESGGVFRISHPGDFGFREAVLLAPLDNMPSSDLHRLMDHIVQLGGEP